MQISFQNFITFKAISLNKDETMRTDNLLRSITNPTQKERTKLELLDIFDKHLQNEAVIKSGELYRKEDFLQRLYLTFLESLENVKSLTTEKLLKILNNTKPNNEELKEEYRIKIYSINKKLSHRNNKTIESNLSEEKILKPKSAVSPEEHSKQLSKIKKLTEPLSKKEQDLLFQRSSGKSYNQIAKESGRSLNAIYKQTKKAIAKIQSNNNILPKEYELCADKFIKTFDLTLSKKEVINIIINYIGVKSFNINTLSYNINNSAKLLKIDKQLFIQAAQKQPALFSQKPETINKNIENTSRLLEIDKQLFIQAALKQPQLFSQKPETINKNIKMTSKLLKIDKQLFIQAALKQPQLFSQKPKTINKNIETTSKLLRINKQLCIQAALKQPSLFYQKPETIVKKVNIIKYYKQIQGKNNKQIRFSTSLDKNLYYNILAYLIKRQDNLSRALKQNEIVEYLKSQNKVYNFTIPKNKLADEFIEYVHEFSQSKFDKLIFNIIKK